MSELSELARIVIAVSERTHEHLMRSQLPFGLSVISDGMVVIA